MPKASRLFVLAALTACAQSWRKSDPGFSSSAPAVSPAVAASAALSPALDRIDQRYPRLDGRFVHKGTGRGVTIYIFDTGVLPNHPELVGRVRRGFGADGSDLLCKPHGTGVASAAAGKTLGVAPEAEVVDVRIYDCGDTTTLERLRATLIRAVDWVVADVKAHRRPAVANWSLSLDTLKSDSLNSPLRRAIGKLLANNIVLVVAAGNYDIPACRISPATLAGTIAVGSISTGRRRFPPWSSTLVDRRAPDTAYGVCVDIYAPGEDVPVAGFTDDYRATVDTASGTSFAAGYVSGAAALYLEFHPRASPRKVLKELRSRATFNRVADAHSRWSYLLYVGTDSLPPSWLAQVQNKASP